MKNLFENYDLWRFIGNYLIGVFSFSGEGTEELFKAKKELLIEEFGLFSAEFWSRVVDDAELLTFFVALCTKFVTENIDALQARSAAQGGVDFYFTTNGHGCGFWDGGWPEVEGDQLTESCSKYPQIEVYVGDDGKFYLV